MLYPYRHLRRLGKGKRMTTNETLDKAMDRKEHLGCLKVFGIIMATVIVTVLVTLWVAKNYLFPSAFKPVALNEQETTQLAEKLERMDRVSGTDFSEKIGPSSGEGEGMGQPDVSKPLKPAPYRESEDERTISFTQREINALLANNTDLAQKMVVDLSDDLISARLRVPVDPDFPILGGKIMRVHVGLNLAYENERPVVMLKGIKLMGVPIPNAWLGGIKNIDLVEEFGADEGFWKAFADGVESVKVEKGLLSVRFKE